MTITAVEPIRAGQAAARARSLPAIVDCDIHNTIASDAALAPFMPERWRRHLEKYSIRFYYTGAFYPRLNPNAARTDAWPPSGLIPGSDLGFMREQLLDRWNVQVGILNPLYLAGEQANQAYGAALATALNAWLAAAWLDPEPRLRSSMVVPYEDGDQAAEEIERQAHDPRFVQVLLPARTREPLGRRKYWKLYAAAERHGLPVAVHFGGAGGWPLTGAGWPSFYYEDHSGMPQAFQAQIISLVYEGVFERFPALKIILVEGGWAWLPPLMWRMDQAWQRLRDEVPEVTRPPSDTIRKHFWITTQPVEEPSRPEYFHRLLAQLDMPQRLMFSTDYPHWDFDAPDQALPSGLTPDLKAGIMAGNARALYGLPEVRP
jgi:predicted TIM-barrel fold metal-dependent hydrolase